VRVFLVDLLAMKRAVVVTGFGPFASVAENPSKTLAECCKTHEIEGDVIVLAAVLETSIEGVKEGFAKLESDLAVLGVLDEDTVWFHMGVFEGQQQMRFENRAFNIASFASPDERGNMPQNEKIEANIEIGAPMYTNLNVELLSRSLHKSFPDLGNQLAMTDSPGTFVCNYCYFYGLNRHNYSVFVHIPDFQVIPQELQFRIVLKVVNEAHGFRIDRYRAPEHLVEPLTEMGILADRIRTACLALQQSAITEGNLSMETVLNWVYDNEDMAMKPIKDMGDLLALSRPFSDELKVVVLVRTDLKMSPGKAAAQVAHAALALWRDISHSRPDLLRDWTEQGEPIITLKCSSIDELMTYHRRAREKGIHATPIADAGRTQVTSGSITVLALGPEQRPILDAITGTLSLY